MFNVYSEMRRESDQKKEAQNTNYYYKIPQKFDLDLFSFTLTHKQTKNKKKTQKNYPFGKSFTHLLLVTPYTHIWFVVYLLFDTFHRLVKIDYVSSATNEQNLEKMTNIFV